MSSIKGRYARIEISLDEAETGKELFLSGDYFSVVSITGTGTCEIKLDHRHSQTLNLREISSIQGIFNRVYLTTDGGGGTCTVYIGTGMAVNVLPNPDKMWSGGSISTQIVAPLAAVQCLASEPMRLFDVTILCADSTYWAFVGPYNPDPATFKAYAYNLRPDSTLHFRKMDMYCLGCIAEDSTNTVKLNIIGRYE